ncbi:RNA polymerase sigma factor [Cytophagaceae bacterium DM2B3-1]|uniref:RNA polymerase sigma factor n=2 Tax=Xanthocytophaga TaxID=3078918 RepID=A0AAE3UBR4_9BACT|nr:MULTISPECIES: RNA polymerase sigma factor [Xanthocytophaga]MDJ1471973.1 RNA polymerase sigma factor [Xanthocytophaga flavus]MDJ1484683.1 RNA polymerase sigma factor [Xanthocytophaga flavus]MDJ1496910.1 RNA polymerase sigma factor [Xanthocytophaga flavus]MDJ1503884.1 RNA polymerase sigma factor [Xanthocytophaga agilis]
MKIGKRYSDEEIIQLVKFGRNLEQPISYLYTEHFENLTNFIRKNKGSQQDAEDIFQETIITFVDLVEREKFRGESSIKTFLYAIARNIWLNELKKRDRMFIRDTESYEPQSKESEDLQEALIKNESKQKVLELIEQLGETCKKILVYYYYENLSMKEIYERMHYESEQVVRNQKYKCMKKLIDWIDTNPGMKNTVKELLAYGTE